MDYTNIIVMLARQRSGTNPLRYVLGSHPDIFCTPEVFLPSPSPDAHLAVETNYFEFLDRSANIDSKAMLTSNEVQERVFLDYLAYLRSFSDKRYIILDVKYNSTHHFDGPWRAMTAPPMMLRLIKRHELRVLNVTRKNYLRHYLSLKKANRTRQWTAYDESVVGDQAWYVEKKPTRERDVEDFRLRISPSDLQFILDECRSEDQMIKRTFYGYAPMLKVEYEDLFPVLGAPPADEELTRIATWLSIDSHFPAGRPQYRKQAVRPLAETIENYDEIVEQLRGTEFEYCLADERMHRGAAGAHG